MITDAITVTFTLDGIDRSGPTERAFDVGLLGGIVGHPGRPSSATRCGPHRVGQEDGYVLRALKVSHDAPCPLSPKVWQWQGRRRRQTRRQRRGATGRFTHPEEVADLVMLLASERAGNVKGSEFVIDGGLLTTL